MMFSGLSKILLVVVVRQQLACVQQLLQVMMNLFFFLKFISVLWIIFEEVSLIVFSCFGFRNIFLMLLFLVVWLMVFMIVVRLRVFFVLKVKGLIFRLLVCFGMGWLRVRWSIELAFIFFIFLDVLIVCLIIRVLMFMSRKKLMNRFRQEVNKNFRNCFIEWYDYNCLLLWFFGVFG